MKFRKRSRKTSISWDHFASLANKWEDSVIDNIDEGYNRLVEHLHDSATKAESLQVAKRRLFEDSRVDTPAWNRASYKQLSTIVRTCEAMQRSDKGRSEREKSSSHGRSRRARKEHSQSPTELCQLQDQDDLPSSSGRNCYCIPEGNGEEHLKSIALVIIKTLARLFTRYLSGCKVPTSWKTSKTVLLYKKGDPDDIGNYRPICMLSVIYKLFTRVILNRIGKILDEGQPCERAGLRRGFSTIDYIHTLTRLIEVSREYKMPLCLTFIGLKKAFDTRDRNGNRSPGQPVFLLNI
uniref:Reverse transcriptase domain-containing protein n=1 Tax=Haemonchus contortus TaxID=6289 RepID=A0A7I5EB13_HAECO